MILNSVRNFLSVKIKVEKFGVLKPTHPLWVPRGQYLAVSLFCAVLCSEIRVM